MCHWCKTKLTSTRNQTISFAGHGNHVQVEVQSLFWMLFVGFWVLGSEHGFDLDSKLGWSFSLSPAASDGQVSWPTQAVQGGRQQKHIIYKHTCCVQNCALPGWADFPRSRGAVLQDDHVALTPSIASQVSGVLAKCLPKSSRPLCFTKVSTTPQ